MSTDYTFTEGPIYPPTENETFPGASINVSEPDRSPFSDDVWFSRIECYGYDEENAIEFRDRILELIEMGYMYESLCV